jgi:hypothetical protein
MERLRQVRAAVAAGARDRKSITDLIYGDSIEPGLSPFAEAAVAAYLAHIQAGEATEHHGGPSDA